MKKNILITVLVITLLIALVGCNDTNKVEKPSDDVTNTTDNGVTDDNATSVDSDDVTKVKEHVAGEGQAKYENDEYGFSFIYDDKYIVLDKNTEISEEEISGYSPSVRASYEQMKPLLNQIAVFLFDSTSVMITENINVIVAEVPGGSMDMYQNEEVLKANTNAVKSELETIAQDVNIEDAKLETFGDYEYITLIGRYKLAGQSIVIMQATTLNDGKNITVTYTVKDEDVEAKEEYFKNVILSTLVSY